MSDKKKSRLGTITRRSLLVGAVAITGGVAFGYYKYKTPYDNPLEDQLTDGEASLTPYVKIDQGGITLYTARAEMGQGIHTTLAAMIAEELDVDLNDVQVEHGPASKAYYNEAVFEEAVPFPSTDISANAERMRGLTKIPAKIFAMQITGGSSSVPDGHEKMRIAGAAARQVLLKAASKKLKVKVKTLKTDKGAVVAEDGTRIPYTDLAELAGKIKPPKEVKLKPESQWNLLGKTQPRVDVPAKSTGTAIFGADIRLEGMLYATVKMNPHLEGGAGTYDPATVSSMPGVKKVIDMAAGGVAIIASNTWNAFQAAKALEVEWPTAAYPATTAEHFEVVADSFTEEFHDAEVRNDGNVGAALTPENTIETEYRVPYLAHGTMEPMNATAWLREGKLDVWSGNQFPTQAVKEAVKLTGLKEKNINIHTPYLGGGFGRRAEMDAIKYAIEIAQAMDGTPVKMVFSREEDTTHDFYRPIAMARFKGAVADGAAVALDAQYAAPSLADSQFARLDMPMPGPDPTITQSSWDQPYDIPHYRVNGYRAPLLLPVSSWRSVGASQNAFFQESMLDEMAHAAGKDPVAFRLEMMTHAHSRKVLETVAEMSNWGSALPEGRARGVAFCLSFGVPSAEVIEIVQTTEGIKIDKAWAAVDVGTAMDPGNLEAQVQSGLNFGLAAAMVGEITVADGMVEQSNFHDFEMLRLYQAPHIEVKILENGEKVRGIGEPGTPPAAPALGNAIFALTGERLREMPFRKFVTLI